MRLPENLPLWVARAALSGSAVVALKQLALGGAFFGWVLYQGFVGNSSVVFLDEHVLWDAYGNWTSQVLPGAVKSAMGGVGLMSLLVGLVFAGLFLLVLVAHVFYKKHLTEPGRRVAGEAGFLECLRRLIYRGASITDRCAGLAGAYQRSYFCLTWISLLAIVILMVAVDEVELWMIVLFLLLAIPAFLYLILYGRDLLSGRLREQFTYFFVVLILVLGMLCMPFLYGWRFFDLKLSVVDSAVENGEEVELRASLEETLVFDEENKILGTLKQKGDKLVVRFWKAEDAEYKGFDTRMLTKLGGGFVPAGSGEEAYDEMRTRYSARPHGHGPPEES